MRNNNFRRHRYRSNSRGFKRNGMVNKSNINSGFGISHSKNNNFGRNNLNASKLLEKYTSLAKEALSAGDKILSENYFQHADHFLRIVASKNSIKEESNRKDNDQGLQEEEKKSENKEEVSTNLTDNK